MNVTLNTDLTVNARAVLAECLAQYGVNVVLSNIIDICEPDAPVNREDKVAQDIYDREMVIHDVLKACRVLVKELETRRR